MIKTFSCSETRKLFLDRRSERFHRISGSARRKLEMLEAAAKLGDLRSPPGNKLEALKGDRLGQHSIRVNKQFRICFKWIDNNAWDVEIVDYH